jgi:hypothetical protein
MSGIDRAAAKPYRPSGTSVPSATALAVVATITGAETRAASVANPRIHRRYTRMRLSLLVGVVIERMTRISNTTSSPIGCP